MNPMNQMNPLDPAYLAKRAEQIRETYMMKAVSRVLGIGAVVGLFAALVTSLEIPELGIIVGLCAVGSGIASMIISAIVNANESAEIAIQKERQELMALYGAEPEKVKRKPQVHLNDEGELMDAGQPDARLDDLTLPQDQPPARAQQRSQQ